MIGHARRTYQRLRAVIALGLVALLAGCSGISANPFRLGNLPGTDIVRTHAKPSFLGYYHNFDPAARTLTITPVQSVNPVKTQHVYIATVCDKNGNGRRNRRVEWHVSGPGHIVEVDESGIFAGRGYLVDGHYAVSYTNYRKHTLTRGNDDPSDDIHLKAGQTWCVITSAEEGVTHVTAYAPEIYDWEKHKVFATKYWVDAEAIFPPPAVNPAGQPHRFTTQIVRVSDRSPAAGYRVRYRILDGPPAVLEPGGATQVEVVSGDDGMATAILRQLEPVPGINRIQIEVIRPGDTPTAKSLTIATNITTKTWVAPQLAIQKTAPQTVVVGQQIPYQIVVTNTGSIATQGVTIRDTLPPSLQLIGSTPMATQQGQNLIWSFGALQPGQSAAVQFACQATAPGTVTNCAEAVLAEGIAARDCATTEVLAGALEVTKTGPATAVVGQPVTFQITVTNRGNGPAMNVVVTDAFDPGFVHQTGSAPVELPIGTLGPGQSQTVPIVLTPQTAGRLCNRVTAVAEGGLTAAAEHCVQVSQPQLAISKRGPNFAMAGAMVDFEITVQNTGPIQADNVIVRDELPPQLVPVEAPEGGAIVGNTVTWNLGSLSPGDSRMLRLRAQAVAIGQNVCNMATVSANGVPGVPSSPACLEIKGVPGILTELIDRADPVAVGGETVYVIRITNQGSLPARVTQVTGTVTPGLQLLDAETQPGIEKNVTDTQVTFGPFDIEPRKELFYTVKARAIKPGDQRFKLEIQTAHQKEPILKEESTQVYDPMTGALNGTAKATRKSETAAVPVSTEPANPAETPPTPENELEDVPLLPLHPVDEPADD